jgi:hypothetical protein
MDSLKAFSHISQLMSTFDICLKANVCILLDGMTFLNSRINLKTESTS